MRLFPPVWRGLAVAVVLAVVAAGSARADDPSVAELQVRLVESRQQLNALHAASAAASERLNGAKTELAGAEAELRRQQGRLAAARRKLAAQRAVVAGLTVEQLMSGSSTARLTTLLSGDGPQQLLEQASAYSSTDEAMTARLDILSSRQVVHDASAREAKAAVAAQRKAAARQRTAHTRIRESIRQADTAVRSTRRERRSLLRQLADVQGASLTEVTERQDRIDERLDQAGPNVPDVPDEDADDSGPTPTVPVPDPPTTDAPKPSVGKVETAIAFARKQLGERYAWGAAGPSSWDCSGLTMRAWQAAGVNLSHHAGSQYARTTKVSVGSIKRGDLLYWSNGGPRSIYHVAMYLGGGKMIHAPRPGRGVEIVSVSYWIDPDLASRPG